MKRIVLVLASGILMASCGSKNDIEKDAKEMCDCYTEGANDSQKFLECSEKNAKMREKYKDDNDALTEFDKKVAKCMLEKMK